MYLKRTLNLRDLLNKKSHFLFGPRSTGKTSLIYKQLEGDAVIIDLLRTQTYMLLQSNPWELEDLIKPKLTDSKIVVIDEIQRIPELLNEVHRLIEKSKIKFLLTGSSARKLRRSGVNLLAGRAWMAQLMPLTSDEVLDFDLGKYLLYGGLPQVVTSSSPEEELDAYVNTYLQEEIQSEALVRKLQSFTKFLRTSALTSGFILNFAKISSDIGVPASTVREYYGILEDTLIGYMLPAWTKSKNRKAASTAKFFFFDVGVRNILSGVTQISPGNDVYGQVFEHFISMELRSYISYTRNKAKMYYWQSKNKNEVDFIIEDIEAKVAIEVKCANNIQDKHLKGIKLLKEENVFTKYYVVCFDKNHRVKDDIEIMHWQSFLKDLWQGKVF